MTVDGLEYSAEQRLAWRLLCGQQVTALAACGHPRWFEGVAAFGLGAQIPELSELSSRVEELVGWRIAAVDGQVDGQTFGSLLGNCTMPSTRHVRSVGELAHSKEPDMFHDLFGHLPWLIDPDYRAFLAAFGETSLALMDVPEARRRLGLAFKWTIEYGLIAYRGEIRVCGAGLMSSPGELGHALGSRVRRLPFEPATAMATRHVPAQLQRQYFVIDSFAALRAQLPEMVRCATAADRS